MGLKKSFQSAIHVWWLYWFSYPISLPAPFLPARVSAEWNVPTFTACWSFSSLPLNYGLCAEKDTRCEGEKIKMQLTWARACGMRRGHSCTDVTASHMLFFVIDRGHTFVSPGVLAGFAWGGRGLMNWQSLTSAYDSNTRFPSCDSPVIAYGFPTEGEVL